MTFNKPAALHGGKLREELLAAGFTVADDGIRDQGDGTIVVLVEGDEATVQSVVEGHVPPAAPPDPDDELDAGLADVSARTDVPEWGLALIANLRGQAGHQGRAAGRRPT